MIKKYDYINEPKSKSFIYALVDPFTDHVRYIGQTRLGNIRFINHYSNRELNKKTHKSYWINSVIRKGKYPRILVLEECAPEKLNEIEIFYIEYFKFLGVSLTNLSSGGEGASGIKLSDERKRKLSEVNKGRVWSEASRKKLSDTQRGRVYPEDRKLKQRNGKNSKKVINLTTLEIFPSLMEVSRRYKCSNGALSDHLKRKTFMVRGEYFAWYSDIQGDIAKWCDGELKTLKDKQEYTFKKKYQYKKVRCLLSGKVFNSVKEASVYFNISAPRMTEILKGQRHYKLVKVEYVNE